MQVVRPACGSRMVRLTRSRGMQARSTPMTQITLFTSCHSSFTFALAAFFHSKELSFSASHQGNFPSRLEGCTRFQVLWSSTLLLPFVKDGNSPRHSCLRRRPSLSQVHLPFRYMDMADVYPQSREVLSPTQTLRLSRNLTKHHTSHREEKSLNKVLTH
jgi:hypothetical protein